MKVMAIKNNHPSPQKKKPKKQQQQQRQKQPSIRNLEFCIISAQNLKNVHKFGRMRTYAVAFVNPEHKVSTRIDTEGSTNPTWDAKLTLQIDEALLLLDQEHYNNTQLTINIFSRGSIRDRLVGSVRILLCDAVRENMLSINKFPVTSYLVFRPKGDPHGILNVCIPPGGRFPDRLDSISFKRDGDSLRFYDEDIPAAVAKLSQSVSSASEDAAASTITTVESCGASEMENLSYMDDEDAEVVENTQDFGKVAVSRRL